MFRTGLPVSFTALISFFIAMNTFAQAPITFFEIIRDDSVSLYFNRDFLFTEKDCYDYYRRIRVNNSGDFNGYFEDRSIDGRLLGKGVYINGIKHGYFEIYYPHGSIFSRGYYENNKPVGTWEYYRPNGLLERVLTVSDSATLMIRYIDETGKVQVDQGSGHFNGLVGGPIEFESISLPNIINGIPAVGKVVKGKPDGRWIIPDRNHQAYYAEKFDNGKLIKSSLASKRKMKYKPHAPLLNSFFLGNYLTTLEAFELERCSESQQYFFNRYPSDLRVFSFDLRQKINYIIANDLRTSRRDYYEPGDNFMSVQFSVDDTGKAHDIMLISDWGQNFMKVVENSINKTVFSANSKTMYFHLKLSYAGGYRYKYNFRFSKRDRP